MNQRVFKVTERDVALLVDVYKHRYLTIGQIHRLHFPSLQTAYRRARILKNAGLLSGFNVANVEEGILSLTTSGLDAVAGALDVDRNNLRWNEATAKPKDYYFMRHFIAINDFRITLRQACSTSNLRLLGFIPDYYGEKTDRGGVGKYIKDILCDASPQLEGISHTPDGVFALERNDTSALFFLEIDRGTEVVTDPKKGVLKCLRFYTHYLMDGKYQRYAADFGAEVFRGFRTLFVTTSTTRVHSIRQAAKEIDAPQKAKRFLWITTEDEIAVSTLFTPIWQSIDPEDLSKYQIG